MMSEVVVSDAIVWGFFTLVISGFLSWMAWMVKKMFDITHEQAIITREQTQLATLVHSLIDRVNRLEGHEDTERYTR